MTQESWEQQKARLEQIVARKNGWPRNEDRAAVAALLARVEELEAELNDTAFVTADAHAELLTKCEKAEAALAEREEEMWERVEQHYKHALADLQGKFTDQNLRLGEAQEMLGRAMVYVRPVPNTYTSSRVGLVQEIEAFLAKKAEPAGRLSVRLVAGGGDEAQQEENVDFTPEAEPAKDIVSCGNCNRDVIFVEPGK
jgi:chromosome segregation ATPase